MSNDVIVRNEFVTHMRSLTDGANGRGILTNARFIFGTGKALKKQLAGAPVDLAKAGDYFDIPLASINAITKGKQGFYALLVIEADGGAYKFAVKQADYDAWEAALKGAMNAAV